MVNEDLKTLLVEQKLLKSNFLKRTVTVDFYLPKNIHPSELSLLLINDGQDLSKMPFDEMLDQLIDSNGIKPVVCIGIHAGADRKNEYGTANVLDFAGRGAKAKAYNQFILGELLPYIHTTYCVDQFEQKAFAGFSLGGLTALDMTWNYPEVFSVAGIFSGSLWWRTKSLDDGYNEETDRIMNQQIKEGSYHPGQRFFFTTGSLDETDDRNNNGIIDSIDDTMSLIEELNKHGYISEYEVKYMNFEDGKHDVATWGRAMPYFLLWAFSK